MAFPVACVGWGLIRVLHGWGATGVKPLKPCEDEGKGNDARLRCSGVAVVRMLRTVVSIGCVFVGYSAGTAIGWPWWAALLAGGVLAVVVLGVIAYNDPTR